MYIIEHERQDSLEARDVLPGGAYHAVTVSFFFRTTSHLIHSPLRCGSSAVAGGICHCCRPMVEDG